MAPNLRRVGSTVVAAMLAVLLVGLAVGPAAALPEGQATWGVHIALAPTWLDPAETSGIITPFMVLYAMHEALVKPMPGQAMAPSLAEAWTASKDGLVYEFALRGNARFHNGDVMTAEDVIQQLIHEKVMFGPVIEPAFLNGVGPRLEVHGLRRIANHASSAPYEDLRLRVK